MYYGHDLEEETTLESRNGPDSVALAPLDREGSYSVIVVLKNGWNHTFWENGRCELEPQHFKVSCLTGFESDAVNRKCQKVDFKSKCGGILIQQLPGKGSNESQLLIQVNGAKADPKLLLSRADASKEINSTEDKSRQQWSANQALKTGEWKVEYRSEKELCKDVMLVKVTCKSGFKDMGGHCVAVVTTKATSLQKVLGVCIGVTLTAVVLYFGYIGRQTHHGFTNAYMPQITMTLCAGRIPENSESTAFASILNGVTTTNLPTRKPSSCNMPFCAVCRLLVSLMSVEFLLAFQILFESWDIFTESAFHVKLCGIV